jgi:hypothetical protein
MIFSRAEFCPNPCLSNEANMQGGLKMASKRTDVAIERIIASCDGDIRGALEALLLVNEHLEAELHRLYVAVTLADEMDPRLKTVH